MSFRARRGNGLLFYTSQNADGSGSYVYAHLYNGYVQVRAHLGDIEVVQNSTVNVFTPPLWKVLTVS